MTDNDSNNLSAPAAFGTEAAPHKPADDREEIYFDGSPLLRGETKQVGLWWGAGVVLIAAPALITVVFKWGSLPFWAWAVFVGLGLLAIGIPILVLKRIRYRISNYRIDFERGLISKSIDTLELWHVEDIRFYQSLLDRILCVGDITVVSHDDTTPRLVLHSVPQPRKLFETLKQRVIAVKRQRGVIKMDLGGDISPQ